MRKDVENNECSMVKLNWEDGWEISILNIVHISYHQQSLVDHIPTTPNSFLDIPMSYHNQESYYIDKIHCNRILNVECRSILYESSYNCCGKAMKKNFVAATCYVS